MIYAVFGLYDYDNSKQWVLNWIRAGLLMRYLYAAPFLMLSSAIWTVGCVLLGQLVSGAEVLAILGIFAISSLVFFDWWLEKFFVFNDLKHLLAATQGNFATRAEYSGGHGELAHQRFVYLVLWGTATDPFLSIFVPARVAEGLNTLFHELPISLLDLDTARQVDEREDRLSDALGQMALTFLSERPGRLLGSTRQMLHVRYNAPGSRVQTVEFANFLRGEDEIRLCRNLLIAARSEAETGVQPITPYRSLPAQLEEVVLPIVPNKRFRRESSAASATAQTTNRQEEINNGLSRHERRDREVRGAFRRR